MKRVNILSEPDYICEGWIYDLNKEKKVIAGIEPELIRGRKGSCKSNCVQIRLISDAPNISVRSTVDDKFNAELPHTGICAQHGLACSYRICGEDIWHNADCYSGRDTTYEVLIELAAVVPAGKKYEAVIYGPIFSYISDMDMMIDYDYTMEPVDRKRDKVLFIGGPVTYGAGVTSTSMMFSNIFARRYDIEPVNLSYYWWNWMEGQREVLNKMENQLKDIKLIYLECDTPRMSYSIMEENLPKIVEFLLEKTDARIVLWNYPVSVALPSNEERQAFIKNMMDNYETDRLVFCDNYSKWSENDFDMYTYDGCFVNDTGNIWIYKTLEQYMEELCQNI